VQSHGVSDRTSTPAKDEVVALLAARRVGGCQNERARDATPGSFAQEERPSPLSRKKPVPGVERRSAAGIAEGKGSAQVAREDGDVQPDGRTVAVTGVLNLQILPAKSQAALSANPAKEDLIGRLRRQMLSGG
jgi:hypothetical protein